jgi:hypothetical protein
MFDPQRFPFLFEFDVCFFRARSEFEIRPKQVGSVGSDR